MSDNVGARGRARQKQLAAEAEAERRGIEAGLLRDLGREPATLDLIVAETLASAIVRSRRLRAQGKNDHEERKQIAQLMRASGGAFKPDAPVAKAPLTIQQALAARGYTAPVQRTTEAAKAEEPTQ
jgi:hypothetical protein